VQWRNPIRCWPLRRELDVPENIMGIRVARNIGRFLLGLAVVLSCSIVASILMAESDFQRLAGRWMRADGGYVLELRDIKEDGSLKAAYFNPRPINVSHAELKRKDGKISLLVELRDVNYPGSLYRLRYDPKSDRLQGTYFQAVLRETYAIEFVRIR
jgi:hypothetical protein